MLGLVYCFPVLMVFYKPYYTHFQCIDIFVFDVNYKHVKSSSVWLHELGEHILAKNYYFHLNIFYFSRKYIQHTNYIITQ